ncbi:hypothetical protein D3C71_2164890 [compost metagenome]
MASSLSASTSTYTNLLQALTKADGVFSSPKPHTSSPSSRSRVASREKSLSLEIRQKL